MRQLETRALIQIVQYSHNVRRFVEPTKRQFDWQGRLIKVTEPSGTNGAEVTTTYAYDVGNRLARVLVDGSQERVFQYDNRGLLVREEHPEKAANNAGAMDPECCGSVFYCGYDARGHAHRRNEGPTPDNPSTLDTATCQARSFDLTFAFDRGERLVQVRETGGRLLEERTYFGNADSGANPSHRKGKLATATRHNWLARGGAGATDYRVTESYFYRGVDGRISERETAVIVGGAPFGAFEQSFQYDHLGNSSGLGYPCALDLFGACASPPPPLSFDYTNGWLTGVDELDFPPKITADISYHDNGALAEMTLDDGDDSWYYAQGMDLNEMQRMAWVDANPNQVPTSGLELAYDGAGNVKKYGNQIFHYDKVSRVVLHHVGGTSQDYGYDPFGNLTQVTTRTYDSEGTETSSSTRSIPVRSASNQMSSGTYDQAGNVLAAGGGATFEWDAVSTMTRYTNGSVDNSFVYTADGERIAVLHDGVGPAGATWTVRDLDGKVLRQFRPDPAQGLFSDGFEAGNAGCWSSVAGGAGGTIQGSCAELVPVRRYAYREGKILASVDEQAPGMPTHYYHLNYRDTPNIVSDTNGNFDLRVYMAFGEEVTTGGSTFELPHKFTGHERDLGVATGGSTPGDDDLDYMHARYYWPIFGRFLSTDTLGGNSRAPQSWNRYAYVVNNPLKNRDPSGLFGIPFIVVGDWINVYGEDPGGEGVPPSTFFTLQLPTIDFFVIFPEFDPALKGIPSFSLQVFLERCDQLGREACGMKIGVIEPDLLKFSKAFRLNAASETTQQLFKHRNTAVAKFIAAFRKKSITREFPSRLIQEDKTVLQALQEGGKKVRKLLTDSEYFR